MGRRSSQKKNAAMLDSDDADSVSSSSTARSDHVVVSGVEEVEFDKETFLDQCLDALYEKRGSTREKALAAIIEAFNSNLQYDFLEKKLEEFNRFLIDYHFLENDGSANGRFATLLQQCLNSIKRGSAKEIALAAHAIGLLAVTTGPGDKAHEILEESVSPISEALKSRTETSKIVSLLECLAIITFIGGEEPEQTEKAMQLMWQVANPKLGPNVAAARPTAVMITTVVSAWSFLLTSMDQWTLDPKAWQGSISYFSTLLDKDDRSVRIAAGEALALIFEIGSLEKFCGEPKGSGDGSSGEGEKSKELVHIQGLRSKVLNQVRNLSMEAGGKGSAKKDLNNQRNTFRDILESLEGGYSPETSMKVGGEYLTTDSWARLIQLNFLKHFLGGGFVKHMQENEFLHEVFDFTPKKALCAIEHRLSSTEKRFYKSPNSGLNKARTQILNKKRMIAQDKNTGHFAIGFDDEMS